MHEAVHCHMNTWATGLGGFVSETEVLTLMCYLTLNCVCVKKRRWSDAVVEWFLHCCAAHPLIFEFHLACVYSSVWDLQRNVSCDIYFLSHFSITTWENFILRIFIICSVFQMLLGPYLSNMWVHMSILLRMRTLRRIFGPKSEEVTGEWRKLHKEELNDPYSLHNIVRVIKYRRMAWAGHIRSTYRGEDGLIQGFGGETGGQETTWETEA